MIKDIYANILGRISRYGNDIRQTSEKLRRRKIPRHLVDITASLPIKAHQIDIQSLFMTNLFMGLYDEQQIMEKLEQVGIIDIIQQKGFRNILVSIDKQDSYTSRLYVNCGAIEENRRLIELIVREGVFLPRQNFIPSYDFTGGLRILLVEWLCLQNPRAEFTPDKPRLPGQEHPGLGALKNMQEFLYKLAKHSGKDAIVDIPEYFHSAVIYSGLYSRIYSRAYSFFSPVDAGIMQAMQRDMTEMPLADISLAIASDCLVNAGTGEPAIWQPSEQIYPLSEKLKIYVEDDRYKEIVITTMNDHSFSINREKYERLKEKDLLS